MKKMLFSTLVSLLFAKAAIACPGGDLIQVIGKVDGQKTVIANIEIRSGNVVAKNKSLMTFEIKDLSGDNVCLDNNCTRLIELDEEDIVVKYKLMGMKRARSVKISDVSTGPSVPVAKSMPSFLQGELEEMPIDANGEVIFNCSKKK